MADAKQLHILQHSLGVDQFGNGPQYRNYFVTGEDSTDYPHCMELVQAGLMTRHAGSVLTGGSDCFVVTEEGRAYVAAHSPKPPKLTRSQRRYEAFLAADCGLSFGEWLKESEADHA